MEQRTLPLEENNARFDSSDSLILETDQSRDLALHTAIPASKIDSVKVLGANLSRRIAQNQKREGRAVWSVPLFYSLVTVVLLIGKALLGAEREMAWMTFPLAYVPGLLFWLGMTGFMIGSLVKPRKRLRPMAQELADRNDVHAVGPLTDTLKVEDRKIHVIAKEALITLLPRLQASDADLLNAEQRALLCRKLGRAPQRFNGNLRALSHEAYQREVSFRIAILQAFAQVGDSRALSVVERLTREDAKTEEQRRIQEAAQECLPALTLHIEQARSHKTLLRAADASNAGEETLLRPASGVQESHPDQLLRPGPSVP